MKYFSKSQVAYKSFSTDFMKNRVTKDLKVREKKAYEKLKGTLAGVALLPQVFSKPALKEACVPLKSK